MPNFQSEKRLIVHYLVRALGNGQVEAGALLLDKLKSEMLDEDHKNAKEYLMNMIKKGTVRAAEIYLNHYA